MSNIEKYIFKEINDCLYNKYENYFKLYGNNLKPYIFNDYCYYIKSIRNNKFEFSDNIISNINEQLSKIFGVDCSKQIEEFLINEMWKDYE